MNRTRFADSSPSGLPDDEFAPESSLLTIQVRRSYVAPPVGADPLERAWHQSFDAGTGRADEDVLKAGLGRIWAEALLLDRPDGAGRFAIRPVGRLPGRIQDMLADGENLPVLMEQINHMAMVNCHSVKPASGVVELEDADGIVSVTLTLLPLASRQGVVNRYLGTLGQ